MPLTHNNTSAAAASKSCIAVCNIVSILTTNDTMEDHNDSSVAALPDRGVKNNNEQSISSSLTLVEKQDNDIEALKKKPVVPAHAWWYVKTFLANQSASAITVAEKYDEVAKNHGLDGQTHTKVKSDGTVETVTFLYKEDGKTAQDFDDLSNLLDGIKKEYLRFVDTAGDNKLVEVAKENGWTDSNEVSHVFSFFRQLTQEQLSNKYSGQIEKLIKEDLGYGFVKNQTTLFCVEKRLNVQRTKTNLGLVKGELVELKNPQREKSGHALWAEGMETLKKLKTKIRRACESGSAKCSVHQRHPSRKKKAESSDEMPETKKRAKMRENSGPLIVMVPHVQDVQVVSTGEFAVEKGMESHAAEEIEHKLLNLKEKHGLSNSLLNELKQVFVSTGHGNLAVEANESPVSSLETRASAQESLRFGKFTCFLSFH